MTKISESIIRNADSITYLLEIIKKLEERIVALELQLDRSRDPNPPDGWYFDY